MIRYEYANPGGLIHVDIKNLSRIYVPGHRSPATALSERTAGQAGSTCSSRSTTAPGSASRPSTPTRRAIARPRSCRSSFASTRPRDHGRAGPDRQRQLRQTPLGRPLRRLRHRRQEDVALPATDQRQSGTVHPHDARALALPYSYTNESERLAALPPALDVYNRFRPHRALRGLTPLQRVNNVPGTNS